jgi:hypothetical protein
MEKDDFVPYTCDVHCCLSPHSCPDEELPPRPHALEQWNEAQLSGCNCSHALRSSEVRQRVETAARRRAAATRTTGGNRGISSNAMAADTTPWLTPIAAYRRAASAQDAANGELGCTLRTPTALQLSVEHVLRCVLGRLDPSTPVSPTSVKRGTAPAFSCTFAAKYAYVNDRLRQVKKEITIQGLANSDPLQCVELLERMVRFYALSAFVLFGSTATAEGTVPDFDASMNEDRLNDCLQALLDCYPDACRAIVARDTAESSAAVAADHNPSAAASSVSSDPEAQRPTLAQLLDRTDRFRSYAVLMRLKSDPWVELQQQCAEQRELMTRLPQKGPSVAFTSSGPLPRHLAQSLQFCTSFHTCNYVTFFRLYRSVCDPLSDQFDPIAMALLQPHVLPLRLDALHRIGTLYTPSTWFSLSTLTSWLALPNVIDAAQVCKSLAGLTVRRPEGWEQMDLAERESDTSIMREGSRACAPDGSQFWALQINPRLPKHVAAPIVFGAFYRRELNRRLRRMGVQHASLNESAEGVLGADVFGLTEEQSKQTTPAAAAVNSSASPAANWDDDSPSPAPASTSTIDLITYMPSTIYPPSTLRDWIAGM